MNHWIFGQRKKSKGSFTRPPEQLQKMSLYGQKKIILADSYSATNSNNVSALPDSKTKFHA